MLFYPTEDSEQPELPTTKIEDFGPPPLGKGGKASLTITKQNKKSADYSTL